jgi:hypothetical protein
MKLCKTALVLAAACSREAPPAPTPTTPVAVAPIDAAAAKPAVAPQPAPTCIAKDASVIDARLDGGALVACYLVNTDDECWRFDLAKSAWSFGMRRAHVDKSPARAVTVTSTSAVVCTSEGKDCKTVPLSGTDFKADDRPAGATNDDRSIVAVWATGAVHVFDASGKRLTTIKPWPTPMSNNEGPSVFRSAHVLGSTIEVRISDTPVSAAIRLYDVRGKKIADVFGGVPMEDEFPPLALGNSRHAFIKLDTPRTLVVVDVATGKQHSSYPLPGQPLESIVMLRGPGDTMIGAVGTNAVRIDLATKKLATVAAPTCAP